jgi:transmembrane protein TMEM43
MSDSYTHVSHQGWFGRIGGAIKGVLFGAILFIVSFPLLFWNEGRAVHRAQALEEGASSVVTVDTGAVSAGTEGRLVHFAGNATGAELTDPDFGVTREGIHLRRVVQMYQWKETKKTERRKDMIGGGEKTVTTYSYAPTWSEKLIRTEEFDGDGRSDGRHVNPPEMPVSGQQWTADKVTVGAYTLPRGLVDQIDDTQPVPVDESMLAGLSSQWKDAAVAQRGEFYLGSRAGGNRPDAANPRIGDVRVAFKLVPPGPVTVMARQSGSTLAPYQAKSGELFILHTGTQTAAELIRIEQEKNTFLTWILRAVGFVVMWIGLAVALNPLKVMADVVGFIGDLAGIGIILVTGVLAFALSLTTIAIAWVVYRPLLGIGLLIIAAAGFVYAIQLRKKGAARRAMAFPQGGMPLPPVPARPTGASLPPLPK